MAKPLEINVYPAFEGYPPETIQFLRDLKTNNTREWFTAHKNVYEQTVKFPTQCFIQSIGERLQSRFPYLEFHPLRSVFRIHRDTRFSKDKTPYKTNIGAQFTASRKLGVEMPGLYVHIEPDAVFVAGGLYMPTSQQLRAIRNALIQDPDSFFDVLQNREFSQYWSTIEGERLKKAPQGFDPDHRMIEYLKNKQWFVSRELNPFLPLQAQFVDEVTTICIALKPLMDWLVGFVQYSE